jgi:hypothetical protein
MIDNDIPSETWRAYCSRMRRWLCRMQTEVSLCPIPRIEDQRFRYWNSRSDIFVSACISFFETGPRSYLSAESASLQDGKRSRLVMAVILSRTETGEDEWL